MRAAEINNAPNYKIIEHHESEGVAAENKSFNFTTTPKVTSNIRELAPNKSSTGIKHTINSSVRELN